MRLLGLDHLIRGHIDMELMALPSVVDELHLAKPLPPFILGFDFFDQARLGRHRRPDARDDVVTASALGVALVCAAAIMAPAVSSSTAKRPTSLLLALRRCCIAALLSWIHH
jgi:hypothetical protein